MMQQISELFKYMILAFVIFHSSDNNAQINVKIGYGTAIVGAKVNNEILNDFNARKRGELTDSLSIPFSGLGFVHGLNLGLRYKFSENSGFEVNWQNLTRSKEAIGEIDNSSLFQQELFYSFNQFYLAYQSEFSGFGMGVGLGYNRVRIKDKIANSDFKQTILNQNQLFAKINLSIYFKSSETISFSLQPFIQIPLDDINLNPLKSALDLNTNGDALEGFKMIGLSFIFYNGPQ